jgi:OPT family oligopeptide transporter
MVVVDAFYSIVKLSLVVIQGFRKPEAEDEDDEEQADEVQARAKKLIEIFRSYKIPLPFHLSGYLICASVCVVVVSMVYEVKFWQIIVAICLTPMFAIGIIVGIGMTDWDVSSSFGKLMMLPFGAMNHGGSPIAACAVCMITISGCGAAGNLMQDFKTGYLVGASPKAMFFSQMIGAVAGCFIAPTTFALFNSAFTLPVNEPSTQIVTGKFGIIYRTLACVCTANGISALPANCTLFMAIFGGIALATNLFVDFLRSRAPNVAAYVPNPMAFSIGLLIGPSPGMEFMVGSTIFEIWRMRDRVTADKLGNIIASGFLAGSVIAVLIQIGMSLGNVKNPMHLTYTDNQGHVYR